jgi:hypothetical protein
MNAMIPLRYYPYACFTTSDSPFGLYARQKWIGTEEDNTWQSDFDNCVASLWDGQSQDGSWDESFILTVHRLFGLHLTVRHPTEEIEKALEWLLDQTVDGHRGVEGAILADDLLGLPFVTGNPHSLRLAMTLFLRTVFDRADNCEIRARYQELSSRVLRDPEGWGDHSDINNILRAFAVHSVFANDPATLCMVEGLSRIQDDSGMWPETLPFYQTVNALAHLNLPAADRQVKKAFPLLARTQNQDGTWGETQKEWNTFLVVHALRNKKALG